MEPVTKLFFSGDDFFREIIKEVHCAKQEVFIETYIFNLDPIGLMVLEALQLAQSRGVKVRLLVDGVGSFNWIPLLQEECKKRKISFLIYHPLPLQVDIWKNFSWKNLKRILTIFKRINRRDHRKIVYIDHRTIFTGSFNITQVHSERFLTYKVWRDTGIRLTFNSSENLKEVYYSFRKVWLRARFPFLRSRKMLKKLPWIPKQPLQTQILRLNSTLNLRLKLLRDFFRRMTKAQKRVYVTNAYFLPRLLVLRSLRKAAKRGVDVALCLPAVTDVWFLQLASRSLYYRLLKSGVRIFEYQKRILHAKSLIIDDWATVGSHNLNHRSFIHDLEIEAVIDQKELIDELLLQWDKDLENSIEITMESLQDFDFVERILGRIFYWFRYWL